MFISKNRKKWVVLPEVMNGRGECARCQIRLLIEEPMNAGKTARLMLAFLLKVPASFLWAETDPILPAIAAIENTDGRIEIFYIRSDQVLWHRWQNEPEEVWSGEFPFHDSALGVFAERDADGCLHVFIIGQDNRLILRRQTAPGNGWSDSFDMGDPVKSIAALRDGRDSLHLFYTGLDNALYHRLLDPADQSWSIETKLSDDAVAVAAGMNLDGRLEVFFTDSGGTLLHKWQNAPGGPWSEEAPFAASAGQTAVSRNTDGRLEVFYIDRDNALRHQWQTAPNSGWDGGILFAEQVLYFHIGQNHDGRMEVFYIREDDLLYHNWQVAPGQGWGAGKQFGWTATCVASAINQDGRLEAFYLDIDGVLFHDWQILPGKYWAGEYPFPPADPALFTVNVFPIDPIYTPAHENWHVNDHCFIQGKDGIWHLFGIVSPDPDSGDPAVADYFGHAAADSLNQKTWREMPPPFHESLAGGKVLWAPHILLEGGIYYMFYCAGGDPQSYAIVLRTSPDLTDWSEPVVLFRDGFQARDPMVLHSPDENDWIMYYTATDDPGGGRHVVACRTSNDLIRWSGRKIVYTDLHAGWGWGPTESPFVVRRDGFYYLFIGPRPYDPPTESVSEWQHPGYVGTDVFRSARRDFWRNADYAGHIPAHAPEIVRDEKGGWHVSSSGIKQGGLYLTRMHWNDGLDSPVRDRPVPLPSDGYPIRLLRNSPNPFNQRTTIRYALDGKRDLTVEIHNILGEKIHRLFSGVKNPGSHSIYWDGSDERGMPVPSGVYICRFMSGDRIVVQKISLMK